MPRSWKQKHAACCLLKAPSCPPQHNGSHQDGPRDGTYYKIGGTRTCEGLWGETLWHVGSLRMKVQTQILHVEKQEMRHIQMNSINHLNKRFISMNSCSFKGYIFYEKTTLVKFKTIITPNTYPRRYLIVKILSAALLLYCCPALWGATHLQHCCITDALHSEGQTACSVVASLMSCTVRGQTICSIVASLMPCTVRGKLSVALLHHWCPAQWGATF